MHGGDDADDDNDLKPAESETRQKNKTTTIEKEEIKKNLPVVDVLMVRGWRLSIQRSF